jgi:hypothetical protein
MMSPDGAINEKVVPAAQVEEIESHGGRFVQPIEQKRYLVRL